MLEILKSVAGDILTDGSILEQRNIKICLLSDKDMKKRLV